MVGPSRRRKSDSNEVQIDVVQSGPRLPPKPSTWAGRDDPFEVGVVKAVSVAMARGGMDDGSDSFTRATSLSNVLGS